MVYRQPSTLGPVINPAIFYAGTAYLVARLINTTGY